MQDQGRYVGATVKLKNSQGEEVHVRHGRGTYTYSNGFFEYAGEWVFGTKHGQGTLTCGASNRRSGSGATDSYSVFEGDFIHGEMNGQGSKRWADGSSYSGSFLLGEPHGAGLYLDGRGGSFEGGFLRGQREGFGVSSEVDREFEGQWFRGKKHGEGRMEWRNDSGTGSGSDADAPVVTHEGLWSFDLRSGAGVESLADGSSFAGTFANDVRSGPGHFKHAPSGIEVRGDFRAGAPLVTPVCLKLRVPKPADFILGPAAAITGALTPEGLNTGRSSSREKRTSKGGVLADAASPTAASASPSSKTSGSSGGGKPLSKKKAEEARVALAELVTYRASLTEGVVTLPSTGTEMAVMDECSTVTVNPGHKLPVFYLCACTKSGVVCAAESGRILRLTLRVASAAPSAIDEASSASARSKAPQQAATNAASAAAAGADDDEELPIIAFCTCAGAQTLPWPPVAVSMDPAAAVAVAASATVSEEDPKRASSSASSASGKKKKSAAASAAATASSPNAATAAAATSTSTPSKSVVKRRKSVLDDAPAAVSDGPPPPFVCDGRCTPADAAPAARAAWCTVLTRRVEQGYALLDEVWLSGACSPGLAVEIVVEDVTPTLPAATGAFRSTFSPRAATAAALPPIGAAPTSLSFSLLPSNTLKLVTAGVPPKKKKPTKKPAAAGTTPAKDKTAAPAAAAAKDTP